MKTYTVERYKFHELEKRINAISRKLDKQGLHCTFNVVGTHPESIKCYIEDAINHTWKNNGSVIVDVIDYQFEMPELKIGDWEPIAIIKHNQIIKHDQSAVDNKNIVIGINGHDISDVPTRYWSSDCYCEHCNSKRKRNKTVLLKNSSGDMMQVGSTCVNDFTGISAEAVIKAYAEVQDIYETQLEYYIKSDSSFVMQYAPTELYLAACIKDIEVSGGYLNDGRTSHQAWKRVCNNEIFDDATMQKARKIIEFFESFDPDDMDSNEAFYRNIKNAVTGKYTKCSGLVAYASEAHESAVTYLIKKANERAVFDSQQYVGEIKERITLSVTHTCTHVIDSYYGTTYLHKFEDENGNVLLWSTASALSDLLGKEWRSQDVRKCIITGTVKAHDVYNNCKQTHLTRCKLKAE